MVYNTLDSFPKNKFCNFCKLITVDTLTLGSIYQTGDIIVHYFCLLLASRAVQRGTDKQGLLGFLRNDIKKELYRGSKIQCIYCKKSGATVICSKRKCKRKFHLPCGLKNDSLHLFCNEFKSFCVKHRPKVIVPINMENNAECIICFTPVDIKDKYNLVWSQCCKPSSLLHKKCVQEMAYAAGYYFKCPFCADRKKYTSIMQKSGIYVPDQDASWERDPQAFSDLNILLNCESKTCICPSGPSYIKRNSKWELQNCTICGSKAIHLACSEVWEPGTKEYSFDWECTECTQITKEISSKVAANPMKNVVLFMTDDLLKGNLHGLKGVKEIIVNNKRCIVLVKKLNFDVYLKLINYDGGGDRTKENCNEDLEKNSFNQRKTYEEIRNDSKKTRIPNSIVEYIKLFEQFKDKTCLHNNGNSLKMIVKTQISQIRRYLCKPYLRTIKINPDVPPANNYSLWNYFQEIGVIKKNIRSEFLLFIKGNQCITFVDSSGLTYAGLIKSFLPKHWPVKIFPQVNNVCEILIQIHSVLMKVSKKCVIILICDRGIWFDSKEVKCLLNKITCDKNYSNLIICQIPPKKGKYNNSILANSDSNLLKLSKTLAFKLWDILEIFN